MQEQPKERNVRQAQEIIEPLDLTAKHLAKADTSIMTCLRKLRNLCVQCQLMVRVDALLPNGYAYSFANGHPDDLERMRMAADVQRNANAIEDASGKRDMAPTTNVRVYSVSSYDDTRKNAQSSDMTKRGEWPQTKCAPQGVKLAQYVDYSNTDEYMRIEESEAFRPAVEQGRLAWLLDPAYTPTRQEPATPMECVHEDTESSVEESPKPVVEKRRSKDGAKKRKRPSDEDRARRKRREATKNILPVRELLFVVDSAPQHIRLTGLAGEALLTRSRIDSLLADDDDGDSDIVDT